MNCVHISALLDDYVDGLLGPAEYEAVTRHVQDCGECRKALEETQRLIGALRQMPVPAPSADLASRVLKRARDASQAQRQTPRRWGFAAGFTTAAAAGLTLWLVTAWWPGPKAPAVAPDVGAVALTAHEVRPVSLAFNAPSDIRAVTFSLELPPGVQLQGHPGERSIVWQGRLTKGRNVLHLRLIAQDSAGGELIARIRHRDKAKTFRIRLRVRTPRTGGALAGAQLG
ncbi:MAG TPA: zf-HC2 domain-containing protein [Gammaproteobacteria bacterium]|nr:zf-HC2 domain-containing protein [Gammaproteobacteria bacterium]